MSERKNASDEAREQARRLGRWATWDRLGIMDARALAALLTKLVDDNERLTKALEGLLRYAIATNDALIGATCDHEPGGCFCEVEHPTVAIARALAPRNEEEGE